MNYEEIISVEIAFADRKLDPTKLPIVDHLPEWYHKRGPSDYTLHVVAEAINQNDDGTVWEPNYNDGSIKYESAFGIEATEEQPSGVGLSLAFYGRWLTLTHCGSRLSSREANTCVKLAGDYPNLYKDVSLEPLKK